MPSILARSRLVALLAGLALHGAAAHAATALWYHRPASGGQPEVTRTLTAPGDVFTLVQASPSRISLRINYPNEGYVVVDLAAPQSSTFAVGPYENVSRGDVPTPAGGVSLSGWDVSCSSEAGRYNIRELVLDSEFEVVSFAADFEARRNDGSPPCYGELRIDSSIPFTHQEPAGSNAPNPFAFAPRTSVALSTVVTSTATTVYGINAPAPISIVDGEYSVNGGPFTSAPGTVQNRDRVAVRLMSAATTGTLRRAALTVGGVTAPFDVTTHAPGETRTVLYFRSDPSDFIGQGTTRELASPAYTFSGQHTEQKSVAVSIDAGLERWSFNAAHGTVLAPGVYEEAHRWPFSGASPALDFSGDGRGCNRLSGRFVIFEVQYGPGETLEKLAANFEQHCEGVAAALFGEIRFNSAVPLSYMAVPGDATPDPFLLAAQGPVRANALVASNSFAVSGINAPASVSISGGQYSVNGGAYVSTPGTVHERDIVRVRMNASGTPGGTARASLTIGGVTAHLDVTTWMPGQVLSGVYYRSTDGDYIGQGLTRIYLAPRNQITPSRNFDNGVQVRLDGTGGVWLTANFAAPGEAPLGTGQFLSAMRFPFQEAGRPGLDFSGDGRGCNRIAGSFTVHEVEYGIDGSVLRFAADFEQRCEETEPPLFGEIRVNSAVPFSALQGAACSPGDSDGDGVSDCVEAAEGLNPAVKDNDVFASRRLFVMQAYRDFLAREGDAGGISFWADGQTSRGSIIQAFLESPEFAGVMAPVARLYFAYFLRAPDQSGLDFWVDFRLAGNPMDSISNYFAQSAEFAQAYGALDNEAFVDRVYRNVLGRAPDAQGLAFWRDQLDTNQRTRGQVMLAFSESPEYGALTANDIFVAMTYFGMLQRAPDAGGYAYWVDYMDRGNSGLALIDSFLGAPEYRNRFLP